MTQTTKGWQEEDCKTVGFFFSKSVKKSVKRGVRVLRARSSRASHARRAASFQTFCLTARADLNTQKYGLFCSLGKKRNLYHLAFNGYITQLAIHLGYMSEFEFSLTGQH